ncbi:MAG: RnfABCDGE type electron transport complex subunit B [Proteobacteria bacterium]|nr:RnfABCDGE type electron transport complex subunit B [Pseudomonadota bacterium]
MAGVDDIDMLLPQTQCTRCGYEGCRPYAQAIIDGEAQINQCPPGGDATIAALAALLGRAVLPLNPANGTHGPQRVAQIDEEACIGCAKCLPPCPVDAILGAQRHMHTVLVELCNGCELCVAPCPVDCIRMVDRTELVDRKIAAAASAPTTEDNRRRFQAHAARRLERTAARERLLAERKSGSTAGGP